MKPRSAKEKGSRLERKVAELIRRKGLDDRACRMPLSGAMSHLPEDIHTCLPLHIECRNREAVRLWAWWEEVCGKTHYGNSPVLAISGNHRPIVAVVDFEYLLDLLKTEQQYLDEVRAKE